MKVRGWKQRRQWQRERAEPRDIDGAVRVSLAYANGGEPMLMMHPENTGADRAYVQGWVDRWMRPAVDWPTWDWPKR